MISKGTFLPNSYTVGYSKSTKSDTFTFFGEIPMSGVISKK